MYKHRERKRGHMNITLKKIASALLALSLIVFCGNTYLAAAEDSYTNNVGFTDKKLPDFSENTTLASSRKTTSRSYGKVKISSEKGLLSCGLK